MNDRINAATTNRLNEWDSAINAELQDLITTASNYRQAISSAKTGTKRAFYEKKFKKVQTQIIQMLTAKNQIQARLQSTEVASTDFNLARSLVDENDTTSTFNTTIDHALHPIEIIG